MSRGEYQPAFPVMIPPDQPDMRDGTFGFAGMSLRDYFAGQALVGWMANPNGIDSMNSVASEHDLPLEKLAAKAAYETADAMLAERERDQ